MFKKLFNKLKISILVENWVCDMGLKWEWWLSMFIEFDWKKILWDTGQTDVFLENAKQMKVNLDKTDFIVLSHFHYDHTWWIKMSDFADGKKIITHPRVFKEIWQEIKWNYEKIESSWVYKITENIYFLWEIERTTNFEKWSYWKDKMLDDTAIAIKTKKGLVVVSW
jgi:7,8-dihydropterin-6-yl-methyl-4-(beta-D-ribofuranosyl)aminobenzene 5'-phosphate synthase